MCNFIIDLARFSRFIHIYILYKTFLLMTRQCHAPRLIVQPSRTSFIISYTSLNMFRAVFKTLMLLLLRSHRIFTRSLLIVQFVFLHTFYNPFRHLIRFFHMSCFFEDYSRTCFCRFRYAPWVADDWQPCDSHSSSDIRNASFSLHCCPLLWQQWRLPFWHLS